MAIERIDGANSPEDWGLDELWAKGASVHIERMNKDHIWLAVEDGERRVVINLSARGIIRARVDIERGG